MQAVTQRAVERILRRKQWREDDREQQQEHDDRPDSRLLVLAKPPEEHRPARGCFGRRYSTDLDYLSCHESEPSAVTHAWIDDTIENVDDQIDDNEDAGDEDGHPLHDRVVAALN